MVVGSWCSGSAGGCKSALLCSSLLHMDDPWWGGVLHTQCRCGCWRCSAALGAVIPGSAGMTVEEHLSSWWSPACGRRTPKSSGTQEASDVRRAQSGEHKKETRV